MNYFIYTLHHFTAREDINSINRLVSNCAATKEQSRGSGESLAFCFVQNKGKCKLFPWISTLFFCCCTIRNWPIHLAPNVWLYSSVGKASHQYSRRSRVQIPLIYEALIFHAFSFKLLKCHCLRKRSRGWKCGSADFNATPSRSWPYWDIPKTKLVLFCDF